MTVMFTMNHWLVVSTALLSGLSFSCSGAVPDASPASPVGSATPANASLFSAAQATGDGSNPIPVAANGTVTSLATTPLTLTPSFSPLVSDYYVRCAAGDNPLTLTVTDGSGTRLSTLVLSEDQATTVAGQYWIRCLPHDFPHITVTRAGTPTPGYYLVNSIGFAAVFDTNGVPVWYARGASVVNVDSPAVNVISLMPNATQSFGSSLDSKFQLHSLVDGSVTDIVALNGATDAHELRTLPNGDHLLFTYPIESGVNLAGLQSFGATDTMADCKIEEIDPAGALVWSWLASDHVDPVQESIEPATVTVHGAAVRDVFHANSIEVDALGNLLISMRQTNALFYVERTTGKVLWKLGGSAFNKDGAALIQIHNDPETAFTMQHDARFLPNGHVTLFDDHGAGTGVARGVEYAIDHGAGVATLVFQFLGVAASAYEGGFRRYADGESVIGWGYDPSDLRVVTELDANGKDVFDVAFDGMNPTYRSVKVPLSQLDINLMRQSAGK